MKSLCSNCLWKDIPVTYGEKHPCVDCSGEPLIRCKTCDGVYTSEFFPKKRTRICKYCLEAEKIEKQRKHKANIMKKRYKRQSLSTTSFNRAYYYIIKGDKNRKIVNPNLTLEYMLKLAESQQYKCGLTGIPLIRGAHKGRDIATPSIDRIDNSKGYEKDNVRWVCLWANLARSMYSDNIFYNMCKTAAEYHDKIMPEILNNLFKVDED